MRRGYEFDLYLHANHTDSVAYHYMNYCNYIERATGKDMDDIIVSYRGITEAKAALDAKYAASAVGQIMYGLNAYLQFAFSAMKVGVTSGSAAFSSPLYHVSRAEGVPLNTDVSFICETLEQEYESVLRFAKKLLMQEELDYVPIIISKEKPIIERPVGGEKRWGAFFASSKPYIEIYYQNVNPRNAAAIRKCLAHEYMHYLHYMYAGKKYDDASSELKEALADFFGVLYSIHRGQSDDLAVAKSRYDSWVKYFGTYWPYANALYFYKMDVKEMPFYTDYSKYEISGSIGKFIQVYRCTKNPDDAYEVLTKS